MCIQGLSVYGQDIVINEFMAINSSYTNPFGDDSDWVELYNNDSTNVDLTGWHLTDNAGNLTKWTFPATNIGAFGYLLIFVDGAYTSSVVGGQLYADFSLSGNGEYLGLVRPDLTVAHDYSPEYPVQSADVSYGMGLTTNDLRYFDVPTPGATNNAGLLGIVADTKFDPNRGFYTNSISVTITTVTAGAAIYYTTDFTDPAVTNGTLYVGSITITNTTCLRAAAFKTGYAPTDIDTHTYLFVDDIIKQSPAGAQFFACGYV